MDATRPPSRVTACPLCEAPGGLMVWQDAEWRVIRVEDDDFPAFYRVVAAEHVREFSDLPAAARQRCMELVCAVERALLANLQPTKINLAALGNVVPHLHWHVIARFEWDSRFPDPVWAAPRRELETPAAGRLSRPLDELDARVRQALQALG